MMSHISELLTDADVWDSVHITAWRWTLKSINIEVVASGGPQVIEVK
jgi:hypothetical protein